MINKSKVLRTIALFLGTSYLSVTYAQLDQYGLDTPTPENPIVNDEYVIYFNEPKGGEIPIVWKADREANLRRQVPVPFGQHSTGQSIPGLEKQLGLNGKILHILDAMNGIHVRMTADEAKRVYKNPNVRSIEPVMVSFPLTTQSDPKWGLDRLDESAPIAPDNTYNYTLTGSGQTIYILDSGLDVGDASVTAEFGSRASIFHDFNNNGYGTGQDCTNHGTNIASVAGGNTWGIAKGATLRIVKISGSQANDCLSTEYPMAIADSLNWLAANAPHGTIVNLSYGPPVCTGWQGDDNNIKAAVEAAAAAGILIFTAAGNEACSVDEINWKSIPEIFVVGGTRYPGIYWPVDYTEDRLWSDTNYGTSVRGWAPAENIASLQDNEANPGCDPANCGKSGTSFSSPYVAGIAALACESAYPDCTTVGVLDLYNALRASGSSTVLQSDGTALPTGWSDKFIWQQW